MAMRRDMAPTIAEGNPRQARLPALCQNCSALCPRAAARVPPSAASMQGTIHGGAMEVKPHPKPVLPLLALLLLASALGVAAAVVLAGVAMLLAAPAYADEGGLLLERHSGLAQARLLFTQWNSDDERTRVIEAYRNPFDEPLAGVYVYRLPADAVVERLTFAAEGVAPVHAVLRRTHTAALVERTDEIGPGEILLVELEYRRRSPRRLLTLYDVRCCSPS
jgi:hypothetical protein